MNKQRITALFAAIAMSSAVLADNLTVQPVSLSHANAFDESKVFEIAPNQSLNAIELSESQMKETEGEFWDRVAGAVIGGVGGAAGYYLECKIGDCDFDALQMLERAGYASIKGASAGVFSVWVFNAEIARGMGMGVYDAIR